MSMSDTKILFVLVTALILNGCRKNFILSDSQDILFQYEYQNHAWGSVHQGYFIDREGNILVYNQPVNWNQPDKDGIIYQDKLLENLDQCTISEKSVSSSELEKFIRHIPGIASSKISALRETGADMGSHSYICYKFDETFNVYKGYLIKTEGDHTAENLNFFSKKIVTWMKDINREVFLQEEIPAPQE